jgi:hypothetical protein
MGKENRLPGGFVHIITERFRLDCRQGAVITPDDGGADFQRCLSSMDTHWYAVIHGNAIFHAIASVCAVKAFEHINRFIVNALGDGRIFHAVVVPALTHGCMGDILHLKVVVDDLVHIIAGHCALVRTPIFKVYCKRVKKIFGAVRWRFTFLKEGYIVKAVASGEIEVLTPKGGDILRL